MTAPTTERTVKSPKKKVTLGELKDEYLDCRDLRHAWGKSSDWSVLRGIGGRVIQFTRVVICSRCDTERHETYALPSMEVLTRRYRYPEGFLMQGSGQGTGRTPISTVRREMFHRLTDQ